MKLNKLKLMCGILGAFWLTGCVVTEPVVTEPVVIDRSVEAADSVLIQISEVVIQSGGNMSDLEGASAYCEPTTNGNPMYDYDCAVALPALDLGILVHCDSQSCDVVDYMRSI